MKPDRDWRLEVWRPLKPGSIARIRAKHVGQHEGAIVRIVERLDDHHSGMARYHVECVPELSPNAPWHGYDPARQHDGLRLDVCRYELATTVGESTRGACRALANRKPEDREYDRNEMRMFAERQAGIVRSAA